MITILFCVLRCFSDIAMADERVSNIRFSIPDLNAVHAVNGVNVDLSAYRVGHAYNGDQWVSIGQPFLIENKDGQIYGFTPENIFMRLRLLANDQREALGKIARIFYPHIKQPLVSLIPLQSIICTTSFTIDDRIVELRGEASNLNQYTVTIEMPYGEKSKDREAFQARIQRPDPLNWVCTFTAAGREISKNEIRVSGKNFEEAAIDHQLFGTRDEVYVTRRQMALLAQEIRTNLEIEEDCEIDGYSFDGHVIEQMMKIISKSFENVKIDAVIGKLSNFSYSMNENDLKPDEIYKLYNEAIIIDKRDEYRRRSSKSQYSQMNESSEEQGLHFSGRVKVSCKTFGQLQFGITQTKQSKSEESGASSEDDEAATHEFVEQETRMLVEGRYTLPKNLEVVLLQKNDFKRNISILYKEAVWKNARYKKEITISTYSFEKGSLLEVVNKKLDRAYSLLASLSKKTSLDVAQSEVAAIMNNFNEHDQLRKSELAALTNKSNFLSESIKELARTSAKRLDREYENMARMENVVKQLDARLQRHMQKSYAVTSECFQFDKPCNEPETYYFVEENSKSWKCCQLVIREQQ